MVTLRDAARLAGTSVSAAAEVLNGSGSITFVSVQIRARKLSAAHNVEYRPNATARALISKRNNIVGLYSGYRYLDPRNAFFTGRCRHAEHRATTYFLRAHVWLARYLQSFLYG